jgi:hypothetical protein
MLLGDVDMSSQHGCMIHNLAHEAMAPLNELFPPAMLSDEGRKMSYPKHTRKIGT